MFIGIFKSAKSDFLTIFHPFSDRGRDLYNLNQTIAQSVELIYKLSYIYIYQLSLYTYNEIVVLCSTQIYLSQ